MDAKTWLIVALVTAAPVVIILLFAFLRGYNVGISFRKNGKRNNEDQN